MPFVTVGNLLLSEFQCILPSPEDTIFTSQGESPPVVWKSCIQEMTMSYTNDIPIICGLRVMLREDNTSYPHQCPVHMPHMTQTCTPYWRVCTTLPIQINPRRLNPIPSKCGLAHQGYQIWYCFIYFCPLWFFVHCYIGDTCLSRPSVRET